MIPLVELTLSQLAFIVGAGFLAGAMRGFTGFGMSMLLAPALTFVMPPANAVATSLTLEMFTIIPLLRAVRQSADWREAGPLILAACLLVPLGGYLLVVIEAGLVRQLIGGAVVFFAAVLLTGWRYRGRPRVMASVAVGAVAGVLQGATAVGGPPAILYLMAGPTAAATVRANLIATATITGGVALVLFWNFGLLDQTLLMRALALAPLAMLGTVAGGQLFRIAKDELFRRFALTFLLGVGLATLLA